MNAAPRYVLDAEIGHTRKLEPASRRVIAELKRRSEELRRLETFRSKKGRAA
jgi:hypothetical protein